MPLRDNQIQLISSFSSRLSLRISSHQSSLLFFLPTFYLFKLYKNKVFFKLYKSSQNLFEKQVLMTEVLNRLSSSIPKFPQKECTYSNQFAQSYSPIGLINVGNSCFLNSILQLLFAVEELRTFLVQSYGHQQNMKEAKFSKLVGKIFYYLQEHIYEEAKLKQILLLMLKHLQLKNSRYVKYHQEDALETLLTIITSIEEKHPKQVSILDVTSKMACNCGDTILNQKILSYHSAKCIKCSTFMKRTIMQYSKYILYYTALSNIVEQDVYQLGQSSRLLYKLKAEVAYYGNGQSGHYIASRIDNGETFYFSDRFVSRTRESINNFQPLILLYELSSEEPFSKMRNYIPSHPFYYANEKDERKAANKYEVWKARSDISSNKSTSTSSSNKNNYSAQINCRNELTKSKEAYLVATKLSEKIMVNKISIFKIHTKKELLDSESSQELRQFFFMIKSKGSEKTYYLQIINSGNFSYFQSDEQFHTTFMKVMELPPQDQIEEFGKYLQDYLKKCIKRRYNKEVEEDRKKFEEDYLKSKKVTYRVSWDCCRYQMPAKL